MKKFSVTLLISLAFLGSLANADHDFRLTPDSDLKEMTKLVSSGDTLILTNGNWMDSCDRWMTMASA